MDLVGTLKDMIDNAIRQHKMREHLEMLPGKVTAVDATNKLLSAQLKGDATATTNIPYLDHFTPVVNDYVTVLMSGRRSYVVIGRQKAVA